MGLNNFILTCEKDNTKLRKDIEYYKNYNKRLKQENKQLKEVFEEVRTGITTLIHRTRFEEDFCEEDIELEKLLQILDKSKEGDVK